ncbi:tumor necrosis factor ligand superfamily member 11-like protein [Labeo rohita]|uniref:Tumor necrosis factor ligand superfamily member 11-like protein n=1 Tax=Labeo rohita TaxID=84645 RepID=A0A498N980_LABRO|nr:tumor necrosis factor ligand superfamily member 11-like protein [Labeo rohita]
MRPNTACLLPVSNLFQTDSVTALKNNSEAVIKETLLSERLTHDNEKKHRQSTPAAHLPIKPSRQTQRVVRATLLHWNPDQGHLSHFGYRDGRILVQKPGLYYIYAKTCFRHYEGLETYAGSGPGSSDGGVQLIQYVHQQRFSQSATSSSPVLMKTGSTRVWRRGDYHMCCQQQGGVFSLRPGDALFVSVSNSWMLDPEAEGSYFGAFRISK